MMRSLKAKNKLARFKKEKQNGELMMVVVYWKILAFTSYTNIDSNRET